MENKAEREEESGIIYLDLSLVEEDPDTDDQSIVEALTGSEFRYVITEHLYDNLVQGSYCPFFLKQITKIYEPRIKEC